MLKTKKQSLTAISIKDHVIRYVRGKNSSLNDIADFGERHLPKGVIKDGRIQEWDTLVTILEECVEEWKLKKQKILFNVPDGQLVLKEHIISSDVKDEETTGHLYLELGDKLQLPFEEPAFDWQEVKSEGNQRRLLLVAAPEEIVTEYTTLFETCKLKPVAADISPLAYYRFYHEARYPEANEHLLAVQCYPSHVLLTVFNGDYPVVTRNIKWETDEQLWQLETNERELTYTWFGSEEDMLQAWQVVYSDVRKLRNYYESSYHKGEIDITKVCIDGDHPFLAHFEEDCRRQFDIPVKRYDRTNLRISNSDINIPERFHETVGLLLKKEV
ncbi:type IV pilus biogenesis protein PilM [Alteribacter populi]|uniref:type IV pilus biogenesis protein PilM n=1 Tax=Alteribacter populi TaxID=2011011 RepID=UPI000BBA41DC|nr:pilus assembly protein PilM [Alteribacter populi]